MEVTEVIDLMALSAASCYSSAQAMAMIKRVGSASRIIAAHNNLKDLIPEAGNAMERIAEKAFNMRDRAAAEMEFCFRNNIKIIPIGSKDYPQRLAMCPEAPMVLFYRGNADLNVKHILSIVGTRHSTVYGHDCVEALVRDLAVKCPGIMIVSGLAYGIDIVAHRAAINNALPTVGILAHGLDTIYPDRHRKEADMMKENGGLLTEYLTHTDAEKVNFLRRNRIVAGMSDATIVVESAHHGGALVTARIAKEYGRRVFAFPGRIGDDTSEGCNELIRDGKAKLVTNADDVMKVLGWRHEDQLARKRVGIERSLFPDFTDEEQKLVDVLSEKGDMHINDIANVLGQTVGQMSSLLFSLEMKGAVRCLAGNKYHLIR
ncbi:MAG: DNA-processing protein DprA [Prevotella sp.]